MEMPILLKQLQNRTANQALPFYLANEPVTPEAPNPLSVMNKWTGEAEATVCLASTSDLEKAIQLGLEAESTMASMRAYERQSVLEQVTEKLQRFAEPLADCLMWEAGKTLTDAKGEVGRLIDTFKYAAAESVRLTGELLELEVTPRARHYQGMTTYVPKGLCSFITPFNFPLNLLAHKVAPALAVGCPFIVKPASATPVSALLLANILSDSDLPKGAFSVLPMTRQAADMLVTHEAFKFLSFTGSDQVGWDLKSRAGMKPVTLELGGNAPCIVFDDADIERAVQRICFGAYYQAGQSCISVQRILVSNDVYDRFKSQLVQSIERYGYADPKDESSFLSPMISEKETARLESWMHSAEQQGAKRLCGGGRVPENARVLFPSLYENVPLAHELWTEEAFGPVAVLMPFDTDEQAFDLANQSRFSLQSGLFTDKQSRIDRAWKSLDGGGVIINDVPSWRVDHMPYGGTRASGLGREGVRYAMHEMSDIKLKVQYSPI